MADKYQNFEELKLHEKGGEDFEIELEERKSPIAVIAIHGGKIERGTTEVARKLAGDKYSFYSFSGLKETDNTGLHITSSHFDEPQCCNLVSKSQSIISIHGENNDDSFVMVGGKDEELIEKTSNSLKLAGFQILRPNEGINGNFLNNICNKGLSGKGLQLEISRGLREELLSSTELLEKFCRAIPI